MSANARIEMTESAAGMIQIAAGHVSISRAPAPEEQAREGWGRVGSLRRLAAPRPEPRIFAEDPASDHYGLLAELG